MGGFYSRNLKSKRDNNQKSLDDFQVDHDIRDMTHKTGKKYEEKLIK